jgi:hypothetical protein
MSRVECPVALVCPQSNGSHCNRCSEERESCPENDTGIDIEAEMILNSVLALRITMEPGWADDYREGRGFGSDDDSTTETP